MIDLNLVASITGQPPTTWEPVITVDPLFDHVQWLSHCDDKYLIDSSANAIVNDMITNYTRVGRVTNPSAGVLGKNGVYLAPPNLELLYPETTSFVIPNGVHVSLKNTDYTFETMVTLFPRLDLTYGSELGQHRILALAFSGSRIARLGFDVTVMASDYRLRYFSYHENVYVYSTVTMSKWVPHHLVLERIGNAVTVYLDGVPVITHTQTIVTPVGTYEPMIGQNDVNFIDEHIPHAMIDSIRFTVGVGRYGSAFTPPSSRYGDSGNADRLHYNRACSVTFVGAMADNSHSANPVTINAGSSVSGDVLVCGTISGPCATVSPVVDNSLRMGTMPAGTYDMEVSVASYSNSPILFENYTVNANGNHPNYMRAYIAASGRLRIAYKENNLDTVGVTTMSGVLDIDTGFTIQTGVVFKLELGVSGSQLYVFIDGKLVKRTNTRTKNTATGDTVSYYMTAPEYVDNPVFNLGGSPDATTQSLNGSIVSFEATKGVILHTDDYLI